jgi:hypothetical protein
MLQVISSLKGFSMLATDGPIGNVDQVYFDDETWTVRYLTVDTGGWLESRNVLISPHSVKFINWRSRNIEVALTKQQVADSPDIDTEQPVSRQHELASLSYYGYPSYWEGPNLWGPGLFPVNAAATNIQTTGFHGWQNLQAEASKSPAKNSHLRSTGGVSGYDIQAIDGEIGHVSGFVLDDQDWSIRYLEVSTRNWWPGKKVLLAPAWIQRINRLSSKVYVALLREAIQSGPEYIQAVPITRDYETRLYAHYGRLPYWGHAFEVEPTLTLNTTN